MEKNGNGPKFKKTYKNGVWTQHSEFSDSAIGTELIEQIKEKFQSQIGGLDRRT